MGRPALLLVTLFLKHIETKDGLRMLFGPLFQSCKTDSVGSVGQCFMLRQSLGRITNRPSVSLNRSSPIRQSL